MPRDGCPASRRLPPVAGGAGGKGGAVAPRIGAKGADKIPRCSMTIPLANRGSDVVGWDELESERGPRQSAHLASFVTTMRLQSARVYNLLRWHNFFNNINTFSLPNCLTNCLTNCLVFSFSLSIIASFFSYWHIILLCLLHTFTTCVRLQPPLNSFLDKKKWEPQPPSPVGVPTVIVGQGFE